MNFLDRIVEQKLIEIRNADKKLPALKKKVKKSTRSFYSALKNSKQSPAIIAELKRMSPSKGSLRTQLSATMLAPLYSCHASAISVVTDMKFFGGCNALLEAAAKNASVPVIAKDFILHEYQIYHLRDHGADAILLIASLLDNKKINEFIKIAKKLNMDVLLEVHTEEELKRALKTKAKIIGINNRSLDTFNVNINTTKKISKLIPKTRRKNLVVVSESGFSKREELDKITPYADAVLIGTALMKSNNIGNTLKTLAGKPLLKVCGITSFSDARAAIRAGADFLGYNFYKGSTRYILPAEARTIIKKNPEVKSIGVFVNEKKSKIKQIINLCKLDMIQLHGDESSEDCKGFKVPVIKALRIANPEDLKQINKYKTEYILLDKKVEGEYGGTGKMLSEEVLKKIPALSKKRKVFLAGGLNPNTVEKVVAAKPYAFDVCSGVETFPGKKSEDKLQKFAVKLYAT